ncbi:mannan-binding lectin serine protease 1 [Takifugu rubripes]|uniref:mannan-binding lectin serine protease 1 n=1 Tax=Takifugu rubripes TaxID=31033 RepID=UPI001145CB04|nr:mannan-binding lectin serine protease 1-like [Takifugu rubripes]
MTSRPAVERHALEGASWGPPGESGHSRNSRRCRMRLFLLFFIPPLARARVVSRSAMFGVVQSPNFPEPYPREARLRWNISVPEGFRVALSFSRFDLEPSYLCEYDSVQVEAEGEVLALFCGQEETDTESVPAQRVITSPGNRLSLLFTSDFSDEERYSGFQAHYSATDVDECRERTDEALTCDHLCHNYIGGYYCSCRHGYLLHSDNHTCRVECSDGVFTDPSGVLSSVDFPSPYPKSSECVYRIEAEPAARLRLQFDPHFDVEDHPEISCPYDHVLVKAGSAVFGPFCGDRSPGEIQTDSNVVTVFFHSDNSGENLGWKITYTSTVVDCGSPSTVSAADVVFGSHDNSTLFGSTVYYICREDGKNSTYRCGSGGNWVSSELGTRLPSCLPACGRPSRPLPALMKRIVGGRNAEPGLFPWQVLLSVEDLSRVPEDRWFGSGALLSQSWVLTAAHVLRSQRRDNTVVAVVPEHVKVFLGLHDAGDKRSATNRSVDRIILHPNFQPDSYDNDIALVRLSQEVELDELVQPVCLPRLQHRNDLRTPLPNSLGVVAGWGISSLNSSSFTRPSSPSTPSSDLGMTSDLLQYVKLPVVSQDECQASYTSRSVRYNITDNMFCAGYFEGGQDTCLGDSGGAFVMEDGVSRRWVVFGLVSWGGPGDCGSQGVYGVYTRVVRYVEWILGQLHTAPW